MKNYLVFHGHFYQPPREDPWTGLLPYQESAAPFHNWNQRITRECYAANAASRFLRYDGRIEDIINNYEILSFNFGTTLIKWLETHAPHVYEAILEADKLSIQKNNGHGNAIAQSYNHTILPLDSPEDARLQIRWGLEDFRFRFERNSEGIWLPETAVNGDILDILIEEGIRYVILSPWQAKSIKADAGGKEIDLEGKPAPWWRPYRIDRPAGSIAAFFYNHELASGISFEHYLQSADSLYTRLLGYHNHADPGHIIHTATDGEIYGHHEPFGDMCLAALRTHVEQGDKFVFTNYAAYLDEHPPVYSAKLNEGENELGSSWSCFHGVSRWYKDCGCSTGGKPEWNQKWRTPLRDGFIALSKEIRKIYRSRFIKLVENNTGKSFDPEEALDRYIEVLNGTSRMDDFAAKILGSKAGDKGLRQTLFTLLEGNLYRMYMFTSCGWFFADISGIEPVQNIHFALKASALYSEFTEQDLYGLLRSYLAKGKSNIGSFGSGADIMDTVQEETLPDGLEAATYFFITPLVSQTAELPPYSRYGFFRLEDMDIEKNTQKDIETRMALTDVTREKQFSFRFLARKEDRGTLSIEVREPQKTHKTYPLDLSKLPKELRNKIRDFLVHSTERSFSEIAASLFEEVENAIIRTAEMGTQAPAIITRTAEISLNSLLFTYLPTAETYPTEETAKEIERLFDFAVTYDIELEKTRIREALSDYIWSLTEKYSKGSCKPECDTLVRILEAVRRGGIEPDSTLLQRVIYSHVKKWRKRLGIPEIMANAELYGQTSVSEVPPLSKAEKEELDRVIRVCNATGIYADALTSRASHTSVSTG